MARLSNVVCKSRRRGRRNLDGCRIGRYYKPITDYATRTYRTGAAHDTHVPYCSDNVIAALPRSVSLPSTQVS